MQHLPDTTHVCKVMQFCRREGGPQKNHCFQPVLWFSSAEEMLAGATRGDVGYVLADEGQVSMPFQIGSRHGEEQCQGDHV